MAYKTIVDEARDLIKPYVDTGDSAQESLTRSTVGWTGKNLLQITETTNGIITVNTDKSITVNGTPETRVWRVWTDKFKLPAGKYTFDGTPEGGSGATYCMRLESSNNGTHVDYFTDTGEGVTVEVASGTNYDYQVIIDIGAGQSVSNKTFYPMLTDAAIKDRTYEPYHESVEVELIPIINKLRTDRRNISDKVSELSAAVQANDIYSAGFSIGDYFESPTAHELTQESWNASTSTLSTSTVSVKFLYHLAHQNQYYGGYNNNAVIDKRTATILVDTKVNRQWHSGDASAVGYSGSKLQTFLAGDVLDAIKADIAALTGDTWSDHLVAHNKLFTTGLGAWAWSNNQYISAPTESQFYGHTEWTANSYQEGEAVMQLELMRKYCWNEIFGNMWIWLRNMQAASVACNANSYGIANSYGVVNTSRASGLIEFH